MDEKPESAQSAESQRIEESIEEFVSQFGRIESSVPGRLRIRLRREYRAPEKIERVKERLQLQPGVDSVSANRHSGSILVAYDLEIHKGHAVLEVLRDLAIASEGFMEVEGEDEILEEDTGESDGPGRKIADAIHDLDTLIYERTGLRHRVHILPAAIAAFGVAQIAIYGLALESLSGPLLLYVAWDVHKHLKTEPPLPGVEEPAAKQISSTSVTVATETA